MYGEGKSYSFNHFTVSYDNGKGGINTVDSEQCLRDRDVSVFNNEGKPYWQKSVSISPGETAFVEMQDTSGNNATIVAEILL